MQARFARATDNLDEAVRFYRDGVGLDVIGGFVDHDGFDGVMLGLRGESWHIELTHQRGHPVGRAPTSENLVVLYFPDDAKWDAAVARMRAHGFTSSKAHNPYWDREGVTFLDVDGYGVVFQRGSWREDPLDDAKKFGRAVAEDYESYFVPLIFEPYANDIAQRFAHRTPPPSSLLEIACGTGVVTRALASVLPSSTRIVATDLNQDMLDVAASHAPTRAIEWQRADAMKLPFDDASFDAVVCQFGAMFFPDRAAAFAEARRVLRRGGVFVFNVWDRIEDNELADVVTQALATVFPNNPPRFMARTPHGYHDVAAVAADVAAAGFARSSTTIETITARSKASSPRIPAVAYCQGSPLRAEILERDASALDRATDAATAAIRTRFGDGAVDGKIQAHVVVAGR